MKKRKSPQATRIDKASPRAPSISRPPRVPMGALAALKRVGPRPSRHLLVVSVARQTVTWFERGPRTSQYVFRRRLVASTSRFGIGQVMHSNRTPLGLHRIARKIGGDQPAGTVFKSRKPVGNIFTDMPEGAIVHRILWLAGLEDGFNRGGDVDTFRRYIYIHGYHDESSLGRPQSCGCIHLGAADLIPLYDEWPVGTLVWIGRR